MNYLVKRAAIPYGKHFKNHQRKEGIKANTFSKWAEINFWGNGS